jgi:DASS family divalent anion:Na+ symporter
MWEHPPIVPFAPPPPQKITGITHYASGQAAVYYASGFLKLREIFSVGAVCGAASLFIWGTFGMGWWKVLGWW